MNRRKCRIRVEKDVKDASGNLIFRKGDVLDALVTDDMYWATAVDGYRCWLDVDECEEVTR